MTPAYSHPPRRLRPLAAALLLAVLAVVSPDRAAAQSPAQVGQWSPVTDWPIVAIHTSLLPNGKVLFYGYGDPHQLWDPATNTLSTPPSTGYSLFCSGHAFLADGRLFFTSGNIELNNGFPHASIYDPVANAFTRLPDMNAGRWYPTNATLGNGDMLALAGSYFDALGNTLQNTLPQVWQAGPGSWRNLSTANLSLPVYPMTFLAPNGRVVVVGPNRLSRYLTTTGTGGWTNGPNRTFGSRAQGSAVLYDTGKVLVAGGGDPPTATAEVLDLNASSPTWRSVASMSVARRQTNLTLLADGKVLMSGGSRAAGFDEATGAVLYPELWDPATATWARMAVHQRYRGYHSTAVLLPDGRVLSAGGDNEPNMEIFSPPYLFNGARPTVSSTPAGVTYGQQFFVGTPNATAVKKVTWISLSSATHATNMGQRLNTLSFSQAAGGLTVTAPAHGNLAPPGYYLLFLVNGNGVPSVARFVRLSGAAPPAFAAKVNFQPARAPVPVDYIADGGAAYGDRGNGYTYGWNANNASNTRDHDAPNSPDQRYDTLNHMQRQPNPNALWEIAVPNGSYRVRLVAGDPTRFDSVYRINVEGTLAINGTPTSATRWFDNTVTVTVSDGRLTLSNATGASNNKVCFVDITSNF